MSKNSNVVKMHKTVWTNTAIIIFIFVAVYVAGSLVRSLSKDTVATYKVVSSSINRNIKATGIALRNETEVKSSKSGYMIYYVRDGERVAKGKTVCTVDETGNIISTIESIGSSDDEELFESSDYTAIRDTIDTYKSTYSDIQFTNIYNFRAQIESRVLELSNDILTEEMNKGGTSVKSTLENITSSASGVVTYYTDGFESKTTDTLTVNDFNSSNYKKSSLKSGDILNSGSTVFKLISDENWYIVLNLTPEQKENLDAVTNAEIRINNSSEVITCSCKFRDVGENTFMIMSLSKYMIDYIEERYLTIEIVQTEKTGLKVPVSAITTKDTYKVPKSYFADETFSSNMTVMRQQEDGTTKETEISAISYKSDSDFFYVGQDTFEDTDFIVTAGGEEVSVLTLERASLEGVYLTNGGTAEFIEIDKNEVQDEFALVSEDGTLKEFDSIVLNADDVTDNQTLY